MLTAAFGNSVLYFFGQLVHYGFNKCAVAWRDYAYWRSVFFISLALASEILIAMESQ